MSKQNGGIIGPDNVPTGAFGAASGVWKLSDVTNYKRQGTWPVPLSGHQVANSCRFNSGSSDNLSISLSSTATNNKKGTLSFWFKSQGVNQQYPIAKSAGTIFYLYFNSSSQLVWQNASTNTRITSQVFRDPTAWGNLVINFDTTQSTAANRQKMFYNGTEITSFGTSSDLSLNQVVSIFDGDSGARQISGYTGGGYWSGYMSEVVGIDGLQLDPTSFGETDSVTNNWVPKDVSGLTFGNNGFYLPFTNASALGEDFSGEDNDFTANNLTSIDQSIDTCTNNFCTLNPLDIGGGSYTFSNGNTTINTDGGLQSTFSVGQGKWYAEFKLTGSVNYGIGIRQQNYAISQGYGTGGKSAVLHLDEVNFYKNGSSTASYGSAWSTGDVIQVAADLDNNNIYFGKNGSWWNGSAFSSSIPSTAQSIDDIDNYTFSIILVASGAGNVDANFGSPAYAISSGNVDSSGMGNFEYAVPSGYYSLCTRNLNLIG
tara:strand:+ start:2 stop:1456 length:1455 start_codon:yes stop_codon:yes gene_type:complete